jgi:hypothetical protein
MKVEQLIYSAAEYNMYSYMYMLRVLEKEKTGDPNPNVHEYVHSVMNVQKDSSRTLS